MCVCVFMYTTLSSFTNASNQPNLKPGYTFSILVRVPAPCAYQATPAAATTTLTTPTIAITTIAITTLALPTPISTTRTATPSPLHRGQARKASGPLSLHLPALDFVVEAEELLDVRRRAPREALDVQVAP